MVRTYPASNFLSTANILPAVKNKGFRLPSESGELLSMEFSVSSPVMVTISFSTSPRFLKSFEVSKPALRRLFQKRRYCHRSHTWLGDSVPWQLHRPGASGVVTSRYISETETYRNLKPKMESFSTVSADVATFFERENLTSPIADQERKHSGANAILPELTLCFEAVEPTE